MQAGMQPAEQEWHYSGADCCSPFSTCLMTWFLPCVTYGRISHRLHHDPQLNGWSFFNGDCCGWYALACIGCQWILQMNQRGEIRKKYGLKGDGCTDCLCACCCPHCDLIQQDKEVEYRENERAGVVTVQPKPNGQMQYAGQTGGQTVGQYGGQTVGQYGGQNVGQYGGQYGGQQGGQYGGYST